MALRIVERYFGRDVARDTATRLEYQGTGWMHPGSNHAFRYRPIAPGGHELCPVCEMSVSTDSSLTTEHDGRHWYFCGEWCLNRFRQTPERFTESA